MLPTLLHLPREPGKACGRLLDVVAGTGRVNSSQVTSRMQVYLQLTRNRSPRQSLARLILNELSTTETLENAMAADAISGLRSPSAARGIAAML